MFTFHLNRSPFNLTEFFFTKILNSYFAIFFTENEGKSVQLQYNDKLKLVALTQQAHHGRLKEADLPPLGALDVIGRDRRSAWSALEDMSKEEAMKGFVEGVAEFMPHLKPYYEALHKEKDEKRLEE